MCNKRVLAMYDVRGKQEYIYRSNKIKEIIGASAIIRDVFKTYLYPAAKEIRDQKFGKQEGEAIYCYDSDKREAFSKALFEDRMSGEQYLGEVVYDGGGNFLILYRDRETCIDINKIFTRSLMKETYSLKVLCTIHENPDFDHYQKDQKELYAKHRDHEARESVIYPVNSLPIVQVDPQTSRPLAVMYQTTLARNEEPEKLSIERLAKYKKYEEEEDDSEKILDKIITEKGEESLLAVIYIDGNNMGQQVQECLEGKESYEECVTELRRFSADIQKNYVDDRIKAINNRLDDKYKKEKEKKRRTIVSAGDEMTIICNARDALDAVEAYFQDMPKKCSSCAGVAIFHSHAPYADAYRLAEECCESGKDRMKKDRLSHACFMDFHYCQGGMGISLEHIRHKELQGEKCSRPWLISSSDTNVHKDEKFYYTLEIVKEMAVLLRKAGRANVKSLLDVARYSQSGLEMEIRRINAHRKDILDFTLGGKLSSEQKRSLIYDMVLVYDLWFAKEGGTGNE